MALNLKNSIHFDVFTLKHHSFGFLDMVLKRDHLTPMTLLWIHPCMDSYIYAQYTFIHKCIHTQIYICAYANYKQLQFAKYLLCPSQLPKKIDKCFNRAVKYSNRTFKYFNKAVKHSNRTVLVMNHSFQSQFNKTALLNTFTFSKFLN